MYTRYQFTFAYRMTAIPSTNTNLVQIIAQKTGINQPIVQTIIQLLDEGNTVPFIARYRKELTQ